MKYSLLFIGILLLNGCAIFGTYRERHVHSSSLVKFLYPDGKFSLEDQQNPLLNLPLRVGLTFVPDEGNNNIITETTKNELLENVKQAFMEKEYVQEIIIIPEIYLSNTNGFTPLEQLKSLYQLDVITMVSYDQVINGKDNLLSLSYLTIVGAYVFPGSGYDVHTMIDIAVIDLPSKRILFRSAGTHSSKNNLVAGAYTNQAYNKKQNHSFIKAMQQVKTNLLVELNTFEERLKNPQPHENITVVKRKGYTGGSFSLRTLSLLLILVLIKLIFKTNNNHKKTTF